MTDSRVDALMVRARRDPRFARGLLCALTVGLTGDPVVVGWLALFLGVPATEAA